MLVGFCSSYLVCCCLVDELCLTLCDLMDCSLPGSSVYGIFKARMLEWVACPPPRDLPNPGGTGLLKRCALWPSTHYSGMTPGLCCFCTFPLDPSVTHFKAKFTALYLLHGASRMCSSSPLLPHRLLSLCYFWLVWWCSHSFICSLIHSFS